MRVRERVVYESVLENEKERCVRVCEIACVIV